MPSPDLLPLPLFFIFLSCLLVESWNSGQTKPLYAVRRIERSSGESPAYWSQSHHTGGSVNRCTDYRKTFSPIEVSDRAPFLRPDPMWRSSAVPSIAPAVDIPRIGFRVRGHRLTCGQGMIKTSRALQSHILRNRISPPVVQYSGPVR